MENLKGGDRHYFHRLLNRRGRCDRFPSRSTGMIKFVKVS